MFSKKNKADDDRLDPVAQMLVRSAGASEKEIETAASDSMLFARIRGQIAAEQRRREESIDNWMPFLLIARRAVPAMAIITLIVILISSFIFSPSGVQLPGEVNAQAAAVCTLADKDECTVSTNDVMATIFFPKGQEVER